MAALCPEFGISRKTGYKIPARFTEFPQAAIALKQKRSRAYLYHVQPSGVGAGRRHHELVIGRAAHQTSDCERGCELPTGVRARFEDVKVAAVAPQ
jgi:hypothetical protein